MAVGSSKLNLSLSVAYKPFSDLKSGIPALTLMPAPVKTKILLDLSINCTTCSMVFMSDSFFRPVFAAWTWDKNSRNASWEIPSGYNYGC